MLHPFDELRLESLTKEGHFSLVTPWSKIIGKINRASDIPSLYLNKNLLDNTSSLKKDEIASLQWLLRLFPAHGFSYVLPRKVRLLFLNKKYKDQMLNSKSFESPRKLYKQLCSKYDLDENLFEKIPSSWVWDIEDILSRSRIKNSDIYDPNTVFTYCRKLRYLADLASTDGKRFFETLKSTVENDEQRVLECIQLYFMQVYYVTSQSTTCLQGATELYHPLSGEITEFIRSEKGHDKLIYQSLKNLGNTDASKYTYLPSVKAMMANLKFCSEHSLLGFLFVVDHFERDSHVKHHPVTDILAKTKFPEGAAGFTRHRNINHSEQHEDIALKMVQKVPIMHRESVVNSLRLFELHCMLQDLLNKELFASAPMK